MILKWIFIFIFIFHWSSWAQAEFVVPPLSGPVVDQSHLLSSPVQKQLSTALHYLYEHSETQLQVLTIPSLSGLTIEQASIQVADQWKLGKEKTDRGVLLLVATSERKIRIEVGQGLEGDLPDAIAKRIIDEVITPLFRGGNPEAGILMGVMEISRRTDPNVDLEKFFSQEELKQEIKDLQPVSLWSRLLMFLVMGALLLLFIRHPFLFLMLLSASRDSGGWGGGGGGRRGGGGWSGGGGGFSGGGASGGW